MAKIYFMLGGARSGKSSYSEELAEGISGKAGYLATGQVIDEEMKKRVLVHQNRRPAVWETFEIEQTEILISDIEKIFYKVRLSGLEVLIIDCITNLVFRLIYKYGIEQLQIVDNRLEETIESDINVFFDGFLKIIKDAALQDGINIIIVSNEVGMGVIPAYPLGRIFRDMLGIVNKRIAAASDEVNFFVSGIRMKIK
ncbi:MAG: bifunctional adenosylcobinamide kinase/adenosylcobinamide-phosphate guanylyltransferase [Actinobacteria bacterium]|nr:bifunctional adenosylcobinamide kinase/adenosylcobinamide-phosphate guanylyltransferase [Actinomycetota bacterium]